MRIARVAVRLVHRVLPLFELRLDRDHLPGARYRDDVGPPVLVRKFLHRRPNVPRLGARMQARHERAHERRFRAKRTWLGLNSELSAGHPGRDGSMSLATLPGASAPLIR